MTAAVVGSVPEPRPGLPYLTPVPDSEPPFDPDAGGGRTGAASAARARRPSGTGRATRPVPGGFVRAGGPGVAALPGPTSTAERGVRARLSAAGQLPPARRAAQVLATALVEVLSGRRPVGQLRAHCAPGAYAAVVSRAPTTPGAPIQLISVRVCQPADGIAEVSATVRAGRRVRAIAFRVEGVQGRWRITALDIG